MGPTTSGIALAMGIALITASPALALDCPVAHAAASAGVLKEMPQMIAKDSATLAQGGSRAAAPIIVKLRAHHPKVSNGEILNYLITAYCPVLNRRGDLSESQKATELASFQQAVFGQVFSRR